MEATQPPIHFRGHPVRVSEQAAIGCEQVNRWKQIPIANVAKALTLESKSAGFRIATPESGQAQSRKVCLIIP